MGAAEHTGKLVLTAPHEGRRPCGRAAGAGAVPFRADGCVHRHRWSRRAGLVPRREDGGGRLRPDRAQRSFRAHGGGTGGHRADAAAGHRGRGRAAATSPRPTTAHRLVAAATATGLPLRGVLHAAAVVEDATLTNITDELIDRDWAPKVRRRVAPARGHRGAAAGLVLLVLLGGGPGGLAGPGRLRRGQQLARRVHPLAPGPGAARDRDRVGRVGEIGRGQAMAEMTRQRDRSRRGCVRLRGAAAPRPGATPATRRSWVHPG